MEFLLIDDDADDRQLFKEALEAADASVRCNEAAGGEEAFHHLTKGEEPDLIFLDINLPVMNGWDFLKKLKQSEQLRKIPVVIYSTSSHQRDKDIAGELGAVCFITKPDQYRQIRQLLSGIVQHLKHHTIASLAQAIGC